MKVKEKYKDQSWGLLTNTLAWIRDNLKPQDVFWRHQLDKWAEENGYIKKEN